MNRTVGPSFNENFAEKSTCGSYEQYTGSIDFDANAVESEFQLYPDSCLIPKALASCYLALWLN